MQIKHIITNRRIDPHHANDLVYEWEDDLCRYFGAEFYYNQALKNQRYSKFLPFVLNWIQTNRPAFTYEMCTYRHNGNNKRNIVPCLIDFYLHKQWQVRFWYAQYWRNPAVCVSSREVYEYLTEVFRFRKIHHLPLSISDRYRITPQTRYDKHYDLFIAGRQSPVLTEYLKRYLTQHPETTFIRREMREGQSVYVNQSGEIVSPTDSREVYMQLLRQTRACLYSTPGMDDSRRTNGFSQVTPRFLEIIAAGCHPLLRYPDNADTRFYRLVDFCPSLTTYELFEQTMDCARRQPVDMLLYSNYLEAHYTSQVAKHLEQIVQGL